MKKNRTHYLLIKTNLDFLIVLLFLKSIKKSTCNEYVRGDPSNILQPLISFALIA